MDRKNNTIRSTGSIIPRSNVLNKDLWRNSH